MILFNFIIFIAILAPLLAAPKTPLENGAKVLEAFAHVKELYSELKPVGENVKKLEKMFKQIVHKNMAFGDPTKVFEKCDEKRKEFASGLNTLLADVGIEVPHPGDQDSKLEGLAKEFGGIHLKNGHALDTDQLFDDSERANEIDGIGQDLGQSSHDIGQGVGHKRGQHLGTEKLETDQRGQHLGQEKLEKAIGLLWKRFVQFLERSKMASILGQQATRFHAIGPELQAGNEAEWKRLLLKEYGHGQHAQLLAPLMAFAVEERNKLKEDIRENLHKMEVEKKLYNLPGKYRHFYTGNANKLMTQPMAQIVYEKLEREHRKMQEKIAMANWKKVHKAVGIGSSSGQEKGPTINKRAGPILLSKSEVDLIELGMKKHQERATKTKLLQPAENAEKVVKEGQTQVGAVQAAEHGEKKELETLKSNAEALEVLLVIHRHAQLANESFGKKLAGYLNTHKWMVESQPVEMADESDVKSGDEKDENEHKREKIPLERQLKIIAWDFHRMEFYFWLNRATSRLHQHLEVLAGKRHISGHKLFAENAVRVMEARELADGIIQDFLKAMSPSLRADFEHWIEYHLKGHAVSDDDDDEQGVEAGRMKKKDDDQGTEEQLEDPELRQLKTRIRMDVLKVLLAYRKMKPYMGIGIGKNDKEAVEFQENKEKPPSVLDTYGDELRSVRSISKKGNELILQLLLKLNEIQMEQQKGEMHGLNGEE